MRTFDLPKNWLLFSMLGCAGIATSAHGQALPVVAPPIVEPATPQGGDAFTVRVRASDCVLLTDGINDAETMRNGSAIDLVIDGSIAFGSPFCNAPPFDYPFNVAGLPPGNYTLRVVVRDIGPPSQLVPYEDAVVAFSVTAAPVPTLGLVGALLLGALLVVASHCRAIPGTSRR